MMRGQEGCAEGYAVPDSLVNATHCNGAEPKGRRRCDAQDGACVEPARIAYGRNTSQSWQANRSWEERVCAENVQHDEQYSHLSEKDAHHPIADKPDF